MRLLTGKTGFTIIMALIFISGVNLFVGQINFMLFGSNPISLITVLALLLVVGSVYACGYRNSRSLRIALLTMLLALGLGIPTAIFLLSPLSEFLVGVIFPRSSLLTSGSFSGIWLVWAIIILIELISDAIMPRKRGGKLLFGGFISLFATIGLELLLSPLPKTSNSDLIKLTIYTPFVWGAVSFAVNYQSGENS